MALRFSLGTLLGLVFAAVPNGQVKLQHVAPLTLQPTGPLLSLHLAPNYGSIWARHGHTFAFSASGAIVFVDGKRLRIERSVPLPRSDVCSVGFDGPTAVVLVGCSSATSTSFSILRIAGQTVREVPLDPLAAPGWPVSFAFGDGQEFVARAGGAVDAIDLRTGTVTTHRPRRTLAKGDGYVAAHWLGDYRLGLNGVIVDVRTWRSRTLLAKGTGITSASQELVAWGAHGASVFTATGRFRIHVLGDEDISDIQIVGHLLYATVGAATDIVDLRTGQRLRVVPNRYLWTLLGAS